MILLPECEGKLWGQTHKVQHCYIEKIHGDGEVLFLIEPLSSRPAEYFMWIDSSFSFLDEDHEKELIDQELIASIIDECGQVGDPLYDEDGEEIEESYDHPWPALDLSAGYTWGFLMKDHNLYSLCESLKNYFNAFSSLGQAIEENAGRLPALPGGDHG